jgi:chorismate dehydratase
MPGSGLSDVAIRLGAVSFLNTRPLVYGLEQRRDRFDIRFDVPSRCAELLHAGEVDLGLIPSIEYLQGSDYRIVPGISIASSGPVDSVALYTMRPTSEIRSIALDTGSRTSAALLRVLCARWFEIDPAFVNMPPDLPEMLGACDAALIIGDPALFLDHVALGLEKIDLGEEWSGMTGLPFVYAFWAGPPGMLNERDIAALQEARDRGLAAVTEIGRQCFPGSAEKAERAARYLQENVKYALGEPEQAGLRRFFELASDLGLTASAGRLTFY